MKAYIKQFFLLLAGIICCTTTPLAAETLEVWNSATNQADVIEIDPDLQEVKGFNPQHASAEAPASSQALSSHSIINGEDWYQVNGNQWPYSASVFIERRGKKTCSGSMIGAYTVLTAAHCVYADVSNEKQNSGRMHNPLDLSVLAGGRSSGITARVVRIYAAPGTNRMNWSLEFIKRDYAILVLDKPIGKQSGYFWAKNVTLKRGDGIHLLGFPGTKNARNPWVSPGKITEVHSGFIYFDADVMEGSSGSPIFLQEYPYHIIGVVSAGNSRPNSPHNTGSVPTHHALLSFIKKYSAEEPTEKEKSDAANAPVYQSNPFGQIQKKFSNNQKHPGRNLLDPNKLKRLLIPGSNNPLFKPKGNNFKPNLGGLQKPKNRSTSKPKTKRDQKKTMESILKNIQGI